MSSFIQDVRWDYVISLSLFPPWKIDVSLNGVVDSAYYLGEEYLHLLHS